MSVQPGEPEPALQLLPDALVRPLVEWLVGAALEVEARELRRAHAVEREAALVVGVDQLLVRRRGLGEDAEPAERVLARRTSRRTPSGIDSRQTPWKPSQPATKSHSSVVLGAVVPVADDGAGPSSTASRLGLEEERAAGLEPRRDQVLDDLLLAVDGDASARR